MMSPRMANDIAVAMSATQLARKSRADDVKGKGAWSQAAQMIHVRAADQRRGGIADTLVVKTKASPARTSESAII